jgi:AcrR family transcriptional regulator
MTAAADRPRRRRANGEASRRKILDAATEIAAERGYEGTSIGLVSERSGLPASSIYWHFKDKDALIAAVIEHSFEQWLAGAGGWTPRTADESERERLQAMLQRTGKALQESSDFLRLGLMLALERRDPEPTARRAFLSVRQESLKRTGTAFAELFADLDADAVHQLAVYTMALADGLFIASEIDGNEATVVTDFDMLSAALLGAVDHLRTRRR